MGLVFFFASMHLDWGTARQPDRRFVADSADAHQDQTTGQGASTRSDSAVVAELLLLMRGQCESGEYLLASRTCALVIEELERRVERAPTAAHKSYLLISEEILARTIQVTTKTESGARYLVLLSHCGVACVQFSDEARDDTFDCIRTLFKRGVPEEYRTDESVGDDSVHALIATCEDALVFRLLRALGSSETRAPTSADVKLLVESEWTSRSRTVRRGVFIWLAAVDPVRAEEMARWWLRHGDGKEDVEALFVAANLLIKNGAATEVLEQLNARPETSTAVLHALVKNLGVEQGFNMLQSIRLVFESREDRDPDFEAAIGSAYVDWGDKSIEQRGISTHVGAVLDAASSLDGSEPIAHRDLMIYMNTIGGSMTQRILRAKRSETNAKPSEICSAAVLERFQDTVRNAYSTQRSLGTNQLHAYGFLAPSVDIFFELAGEARKSPGGRAAVGDVFDGIYALNLRGLLDDARSRRRAIEFIAESEPMVKTIPAAKALLLICRTLAVDQLRDPLMKFRIRVEKMPDPNWRAKLLEEIDEVVTGLTAE